MNKEELRDLLEHLHDKYNRPEFIEPDPISIPHSFSDRHDREVAGFMAATIAWGNRKAIVKSAARMMQYMDYSPADFVRNASASELAHLQSYVHRTFNGQDFTDFVLAIRGITERWGGIGEFFERNYVATQSIPQVLSLFRKEFFSIEHNPHCEKHLSSIDKGAACKRLNMYLRWFVRRDDRGVDWTMEKNSDVGIVSTARCAYRQYGSCARPAHSQTERLEGNRRDNSLTQRILQRRPSAIRLLAIWGWN